MEKIKCWLGFHRWCRWKIEKEGYIEDMLIRRCGTCGKEEIYIGMTEIDTAGRKSPYTYKH